MCFSALSHCQRCDSCGRHHPGNPTERCLEFRAETEAQDLTQELTTYLASPEAAFFTWLAHQA